MKIDYRETITQTIEGVGIYAPSGHFAEVHLLLEPGKPGSGLVFKSKTPIHILDKKWQKQVLYILKSVTHRGVLIGAPITDLKITLIGGSQQKRYSHAKDYYEATKRAVRQGLMKLRMRDAVLLLSSWDVSQVILDPSDYGEVTSIIMKLQGKIEKVITNDKGKISLEIEISAENCLKFKKYLLLKNYSLKYLKTTYYPDKKSTQVVSQMGYDPLADLDNSPSAVACHHASDKLIVPWDQVEKIAFYPMSKISQ